MRKIFFLLTTTLTVLLFANVADASVTCTPIYGGGQTCVSKGEINIDKKVKDPASAKGSEKFVDNLSINEAKYKAGEEVKFKLTVTNAGDTTLDTVEVKDILPQYVTFVSGPGSFDAGSNTLTYSLVNLKPKESRTDTLVVKVVEAGKLPIREGTLCAVNQSSITAEGMSDQDNATFCVERKAEVTKGGLPVKPAPPIKEAPATGPEMTALFALIPAGLSGLILRRKSMKIKGGER